jgi:dienelactone hydrolase
VNFISTNKKNSLATLGAVLISLGTELPTLGATFNPEPIFDSATSTELEIPRSDGGVDAADIYYPLTNNTSQLPVALLLQGALVDKSDYSNFASTVARYGFVVVVPNHVRTAVNPMGEITGLLAEQQQVNDVLSYIKEIDSDPSSPVANLVNPNTLVLLGHSFGGAVGLAAIQDRCFPVLCTQEFSRPDELKGGAFYGTNFRIGQGLEGNIVIENDGIPIALIQGTRDSVASFDAATATYAGIQDPPQAFITLNGANHYGITNEDNLMREPVRPTLEQDVATETIARWSALFLRGTVLNDTGAFNYVFNTGDALDENVSVQSVATSVWEPTTVVGLLAFGAVAISCKRRGV